MIMSCRSHLQFRVRVRLHLLQPHQADQMSGCHWTSQLHKRTSCLDICTNALSGKIQDCQDAEDVALVSLLYIRFGANAHCNGQACSETFEAHALHIYSAVDTIERHHVEGPCFDVVDNRAAHWARKFGLTL